MSWPELDNDDHWVYDVIAGGKDTLKGLSIGFENLLVLSYRDGYMPSYGEPNGACKFRSRYFHSNTGTMLHDPSSKKIFVLELESSVCVHSTFTRSPFIRWGLPSTLSLSQLYHCDSVLGWRKH